MKTPTIPLTQIEIGSRFRKDYGDIDQLMYSIKKNGLINPVAVGVAEKMKIPRESDLPFILLAGGRRMLALKELGWSMIPVNIYEKPLSELDFRAIELAENFDRKEMSYEEELRLKLEVDRLQKQIHGEKIGKAPDSPGWSSADTADLLKESAATVSRDLKLAKAMEDYPELDLGSCKSKSEAMKKLRNIGTLLANRQAAASYTSEMGESNQIFKKLANSYIIGDCFETLAKLPSGSMNIIEVDPPYAIDLKKVKKDNDCIGYNEIKADDYEAFMSKLFSECFRVMRQDSWLICWFAQDPWFNTILALLRNVGFTVIGIPGVWTKPNGQTNQPETALPNSYEAFFYARKGKPKIHKFRAGNEFDYKPVPHTKKYHPTQRPIELMIELFQTFSYPGASGFIPFLGSGVSLLAGHVCQMNLVGTDLTPEFKDGYILQLKEILKHENGT